MAGRGIGLYRPDGWSGYPIDVAAGVHPCGLLLEPAVCHTLTFNIGDSTGSDPGSVERSRAIQMSQVLGSYTPRWSMSRAAVVHMGTVRGVSDGWLEQATEVALTLRALESSGGFTLMLHELSCGFYRVCVGDKSHSIAIAENLSRQIRNLAPRDDFVNLLGTTHVISLGLCDSPQAKAEGFARTHGVVDQHGVIVARLEEMRDEMRLHYPPSLAELETPDGTTNTFKAYVGDDTRKIAREGCVALAPAAEVEACTAQLAQALDDGLPEQLRYHSLCG